MFLFKSIVLSLLDFVYYGRRFGSIIIMDYMERYWRNRNGSPAFLFRSTDREKSEESSVNLFFPAAHFVSFRFQEFAEIGNVVEFVLLFD